MPFTEEQTVALRAKLSAKHIKTRTHNGVTLSYIEAWHAIAEANRVFGHDGWDRETVSTRCVWEGSRNGRKGADYIAQVRIQVRAGDTLICREGSGSGHGTAPTLGEAHESALKEAETDAMKRALTTFGNPFGLALYDKEQRGVRPTRKKNGPKLEGRPVSWVVFSSTGEPMNELGDPVEYCSAVRLLLETIRDKDQIEAFWQKNQPTVAALRQGLPELVTEKGEHYADILCSLYARRFEEFNGEGDGRRGRRKAPGGVDKPVLSIAAHKRVRDREHLRRVAAQPCLVCGRSPSQAHHVRYAQPRALGRKVSDEWVVPLCATHHRDLHGVGDERGWWKNQRLDPIPEAKMLWGESRGELPAENDTDESVLPELRQRRGSSV